MRRSPGSKPIHVMRGKDWRSYALRCYGESMCFHSACWRRPRLKKQEIHYGRTALHLAASAGHADVVQILLLHGADPLVKATAGDTPLHGARRAGHENVVDALLRHGTPAITMPSATQFGHSHLSTQENNNISLSIAAIAGHKTIVRMLLEYGALLVEVRGWHGMTALHGAAIGGHRDIAKLLLEHQADISLVDHDGETALHKASRFGRVGVMELLLKNGVDYSLRNREGMSAADLLEKIVGNKKSLRN